MVNVSGHKLSYLVVDHHMDCTMCGIGGELTEVESLIHNSLSSKSSVPMHQDGHHLEITSHRRRVYLIYNSKHKMNQHLPGTITLTFFP